MTRTRSCNLPQFFAPNLHVLVSSEAKLNALLCNLTDYKDDFAALDFDDDSLVLTAS